jgi:hypothetical protein
MVSVRHPRAYKALPGPYISVPPHRHPPPAPPHHCRHCPKEGKTTKADPAGTSSPGVRYTVGGRVYRHIPPLPPFPPTAFFPSHRSPSHPKSPHPKANPRCHPFGWQLLTLSPGSLPFVLLPLPYLILVFPSLGPFISTDHLPSPLEHRDSPLWIAGHPRTPP